MEILSARNKAIKATQPESDSQANKAINDIKTKSHIISLRINTLLYNTLHNYLVASHNVSDYTFSSISDILRHILTQIEKNGFSTDETISDQDSEYTETIVRVTKEQKQVWQNLPNRNRRKIMEKAIIAFSKQKL
jgi:hypothetical protein